MKAYIIDTETTDTEAKHPIEVAWLKLASEKDMLGDEDGIAAGAPVEDAFGAYYRPPVPISFGAMAVHHIIPQDLNDAPSFETFKLPDDVGYLIGHSVDFDWEAIGRPDIPRICTFAMSQHLWPEADSHSQTALIYRLYGPKPEIRDALRDAHSAAVDVVNCARLLRKILARLPDVKTWRQLWQYSEQCRVPLVMPLGEKQGVKGMPLNEAVLYDRGFCEWVCRQEWADPYLVKGLSALLKEI